MKSKPIKSLCDLSPDPHNANKGTERGVGMLEHSLRTYGAGRSILCDKNGAVIAGNKTLERAADLGMEVEVVQSDGKKLVVVQRTDLDLGKDPAARELAYADNRAGEVGLEWDMDVLSADLAAGVDLGQFWLPGELDILPASGPELDAMEYRIVVDCASESEQHALLNRFEKEGLTCRALIS